MAKYRILTQTELNELEKEFVQYLVVNGITAENWEQIKSTETERAEEIIDLFSDVIFEGILRKVKFLDYRSEHSLKSFQCLEDKIVLVGVDVDESVNLLDVQQFNTVVSAGETNSKIYTSEKPYTKPRQEELYDMLTHGCEIADGELFKNLCVALPNNQ